MDERYGCAREWKVEEYHRMKEESKSNVQKLAHDMKHHILVIQEMIKKAEHVEALNYLNKIKVILKENNKYFDTGCLPMDMILSEKMFQAEQCGIKVNFLYEPECLREYEPMLLYSIIGNAFDNAIKAVNEMESGEKWIDIKIRMEMSIEDMILIIVNNPYSRKIKKEKKAYFTAKRNKTRHDLELRCIQDAVNGFHGEMSILEKDNVFSLMILISS